MPRQPGLSAGYLTAGYRYSPYKFRPHPPLYLISPVIHSSDPNSILNLPSNTSYSSQNGSASPYHLIPLIHTSLSCTKNPLFSSYTSILPSRLSFIPLIRISLYIYHQTSTSSNPAAYTLEQYWGNLTKDEHLDSQV